MKEMRPSYVFLCLLLCFATVSRSQAKTFSGHVDQSDYGCHESYLSGNHVFALDLMEDSAYSALKTTAMIVGATVILPMLAITIPHSALSSLALHAIEGGAVFLELKTLKELISNKILTLKSISQNDSYMSKVIEQAKDIQAKKVSSYLLHYWYPEFAAFHSKYFGKYEKPWRSSWSAGAISISEGEKKLIKFRREVYKVAGKKVSPKKLASLLGDLDKMHAICHIKPFRITNLDTLIQENYSNSPNKTFFRFLREKKIAQKALNLLQVQ